jgi:hypothetical protein
MQRSLVSFILAAIVSVGCSSAPPPPPVAPPPPAPKSAPRPAPKASPTAESEIGGLNEEAMEKAFTALGGTIQNCLETGMQRVVTLGGQFKLALRIDRRGAARWAYLRESTLGDRDTEKCVLDAARAATWPRPLGGEGLAEKAYDFDAQVAPVALDTKRVRIEIARARKAAAACRQGVDGAFLATAYVRPDGRVLSAGVAPPNEQGEDVADCVVDAIRKTRFRPIGSRAKVSFEIL